MTITTVAILLLIVGAPSITPVVVAKGGGLEVAMEGFSFGGGTAGSGSMAFAAFFSSASSRGVGGFSGALSLSGGGVTFDMLGVFSVASACKGQSVPSCKGQAIPPLSCGLTEEVALLGTVTSGNFLGLHVLVLACVGANVTVEVFYGGPFEPFAYSGKGSGNIVASTSRILGGAVVAGKTVGTGTSGTGNLYVDEVLVVFEKSDGTVATSGGGAFVGALDGVLIGGVNQISRVSGQTPCTVALSGVISAGSFVGDELLTSVSWVTCPPSAGVQPINEGVRIIATPDNIIYSGKGSGLVGSIPFVGGVL